MNRRNFLKKIGFIGLGTMASVAVFDRVSQKIREIVDAEYSLCLAKTIEQVKRFFPEVDQWSDSEEWANDILTAFEKSNLKITDENIGIVLTLIRSSSGFRSDPRSIDFIPTLPEQFFHQIGIKSPKTSGPMETSVQFVIEKKGVGYEEALVLLAKRLEGLELGIAFLKSVIEEYANVKDTKKRLLCIFADYNAGRGASKRAGIQAHVARLSGKNIERDGVFGNETIDAIDDIFKKNDIPIFRKDIISELKDDRADLIKTSTYKKLCELAQFDSLQPQVATTRVPGVIGFLKESLTGVRTAKDYAEKRWKEYENILATIKSSRGCD